MDVADVLDKAADLLTPESAWTQGAFARDKFGKEVNANNANAICWCMLGAIQKAALGSGPATLYSKTVDFARLIIAGENSWIDNFNDDPNRTQAEAVSALREAAILARKDAN